MENVRQSDQGLLERSCAGLPKGRNRIRIGRGGFGIERAEAHLQGQAFTPHRHDTCAIGITLAGVQTFRYRGEQRHCLPGQCHILHPDELHDGGAGTEEGFAYRMLYLDPHLVQQALDGQALPFVRCPVLEGTFLPPGFAAEAWDIDTELDDLASSGIVVDAAHLLQAAASKGLAGPAPLALGPLLRVRDMLADAPGRRNTMAELERLCGLDRWTIARQFRALFGTSPSRFRILRQLDRVRRLLASGAGLARAALEAGFADQSHMTRQFKKAYGLTPAAWVHACRPFPASSW